LVDDCDSPRRFLRQQREDRIDLAALQGIGEALNDVSQAPVADRSQACLLASLREPLVDHAARA
jgi:hypothetical protein